VSDPIEFNRIARFLDTLQIGSNSSSLTPMASVQMLPGNPIPASVAIDHRGVQNRRRCDVRRRQYFIGEESNQAQRLACYAV
jgi:hypothetical protein